MKHRAASLRQQSYLSLSASKNTTCIMYEVTCNCRAATVSNYFYCGIRL